MLTGKTERKHRVKITREVEECRSSPMVYKGRPSELTDQTDRAAESHLRMSESYLNPSAARS